MKSWEPAVWIVTGLALAAGLLGQCRETSAYQLFSFKVETTAVTHAGPLDGYLAEALREWGAYSAVTDGGPGRMLVVDFDEADLPDGYAGEAHPIDQDGDFPGLPGDYVASCRIAVSSAIWSSSSETDRQRLITHEVGHCLGIAHSDIRFTLMEPRQAAGEPHGPMTCDDAAAIAKLYPRAGAAMACLQPQAPAIPVEATPTPRVMQDNVSRFTSRLYVTIARN